jgi:hypothetical protein
MESSDDEEVIVPKVSPKKKVEDIHCFHCSCIVPLAYMQCKHCLQAFCDECCEKGCNCRSKKYIDPKVGTTQPKKKQREEN